jgi:hypothetical protein
MDEAESELALDQVTIADFELVVGDWAASGPASYMRRREANRLRKVARKAGEQSVARVLLYGSGVIQFS